MKNKKRIHYRPKALKTPLLPDLVALPPTDLQITTEKNKGQSRTLLRLSQSFGNIGRGPLQVRRGNSTPSCPGKDKAIGYQEIYSKSGLLRIIPLKECMVYHPQHKHWHVANIARYDLCQIDPVTGGPGKILASTDKISFCLVDVIRLNPKQYQGPKYGQRYTSCNTRISGITPGWADVYYYNLYGQWIDITGIKDGTYYLKITMNPKRLFIEETYRNNVAQLKININGKNVSIIKK